MGDHEKVLTAAMHMDGQAYLWYLEYVENRDDVDWDKFVEMVIERFSNVEGRNLVAQFNKLKQEGSAQEYIQQFEELKAFMINNNRSLTEEYFVQSFISGLKDEIGRMVEMFNPKTLSSAIQLAKKQEMLLGSLGRGGRMIGKWIIGPGEHNWKRGTGDTNQTIKPQLPSSNQGRYAPIKKLSNRGKEEEKLVL